jgi:PAS domain S-box-containing protein
VIPSILIALAALVAVLLSRRDTRSRNTQRELLQHCTDRLERFEFAVLAAKVGIWEWDIQRDILDWDDRMLELYGITRAQFSSHVDAWRDALHPDDAERAVDTLNAAIRGERVFELSFRIIRPDGSERTLQANGWAKRDALGSAITIYGLNRDITEFLRTQQNLQEISAYFEAAMSQSQVGIIIADAPHGSFRFANDAAISIAGRPRDEIIQEVSMEKYGSWKIHDTSGSTIPDRELPLSRALIHGETISRELMIERGDGQKRIVLSNSAPIRRSDGSIMAAIAIFLDTTERHRLIEELQAARESAEVASVAKSRFLDIAAHELRTPVTAFSLLLQLLEMQVAENKPIDPSMLQRLRAQVDRLSRLVVDLLEVSRLDRGVLVLKPESNDLAELVGDCIENFRIQHPKRRIEFHRPENPVVAHADPVRIYEVASNLIDNAIKYTPESSLIEVTVDDLPASVRISVADQGPGISREQQDSLFEAFERGPGGDEASHSGLGLGLYISRKIVEMHGGNIAMESSVGSGSRFHFTIPKAPPASEAA